MVESKFLNSSNDRHAAVTDGVFAIAMTILVLEIAVPTITDISSGVALNEYFINSLAPSILIYFISFYIVYNFWENLLIKNNFEGYFAKKDELKTTLNDSRNDGIELPNLKLYMRGITLTLFYLLLAPVISSLLSLILAFLSPVASILSFLLTLILVFFIRTKRFGKDNFDEINLTDDEKELIGNIRRCIYGE